MKISVRNRFKWEIIDTNQIKVPFLSRVIVLSKYFIVFFKMQVFLATFFLHKLSRNFISRLDKSGYLLVVY